MVEKPAATSLYAVFLIDGWGLIDGLMDDHCPPDGQSLRCLIFHNVDKPAGYIARLDDNNNKSKALDVE